MQKAILQTKNGSLTISEDGNIEYVFYGEAKNYQIDSFDEVFFDEPKLLKKGVIGFYANDKLVFGIEVPYSQRYSYYNMVALLQKLHDND